MGNKISLKEWVSKYDNGDFDVNSSAVMVEAGWYDWFCKETSLLTKLKKMIPIVKTIAKSNLIDPDKVYVFFKNNCPVNGNLYDSLSICDIETGDVLYWVAPKQGYRNQEHSVISKSPDFGVNVLNMNERTVWGIKRYFKNKGENHV
jgi:hypothetical protein